MTYMRHSSLFHHTIAFMITICLTLVGCKQAPKQTSIKSKPKSEKEKKEEFKERLKPEYIRTIVSELLTPHFKTIDTIVYDKEPEDIQKYSYPYYDVITKVVKGDVRLEGTVYGTAKVKSKPPYKFETRGEVIYNKKMETSDFIKNLQIKDANDEFIYYEGMDLLEANRNYLVRKIAKQNDDLKKKEEIERAKKKMKFSIDGINVEYAYNEGKSYVYKSSKQLSSEQIVQAIHNIGGNGMNMIQFRDAYEHYADYVYSTQCIIYKSSHDIYKVENGKPVRAN